MNRARSFFGMPLEYVVIYVAVMLLLHSELAGKDSVGVKKKKKRNFKIVHVRKEPLPFMVIVEPRNRVFCPTMKI